MRYVQRSILALVTVAPVLVAACGTSVTLSPGDGGVKGSGADSGIHPGGHDAGYVNPCTNGGQTTISGKIFDPAGRNPLYGVAVYATTATSLPPLSNGASCASCDSLYAGVPIISSTVTDSSGAFKLANAPTGAVSLVVQVGKWRRLFPVTVNSCQDNPQGEGTLRLPKNGSEGDIPQIAVSTGAADSIECMLGRIGLDATEYTGGAGGTGHIHIFQGGAVGPLPVASFTGSSATSAANLWDQASDMMPYDVVLLSCEGQAVTRTPAQLQALADYTNAGGRVFMSHYHYDWLNAGPFGDAGLADWSSAGGLGGFSANGTIVRSLPNGQPFPKGEALHDWLLTVDALVNDELPVSQPKYDAVVKASNTSSQPWIVAPSTKQGADSATVYFSFNTPLGAPLAPDGGPGAACGRAVFSDLHVSSTVAPSTPCSDYYENSLGVGVCVPSRTRSAPGGCASGGLSPQEKALEFMLFDLSSCVVPDTQAPPPPPSIPQ